MYVLQITGVTLDSIMSRQYSHQTTLYERKVTKLDEIVKLIQNDVNCFSVLLRDLIYFQNNILHSFKNTSPTLNYAHVNNTLFRAVYPVFIDTISKKAYLGKYKKCQQTHVMAMAEQN